MARFGKQTTGREGDDWYAPQDEPAGSDVAVPEDAAAAVISPQLAAAVRELCADIPGDDGNGGEAIVRALLAARSIDDLNEPWESTSGRKLAGRRLTIRSVTQRPSQFEDGHGIFLVADAADAKTGEQVTFTTSAVSVVIQLAKARQLGMFPLTADVVVAERPTARGFYPYHLRVVAAGSSAKTE